MGRRFKSGNWLHFQCVETQWIEEEGTAVDTKMDTSLAMLSMFCQNVARVTPVAANAKVSHFITIIVMKRYRLVKPHRFPAPNPIPWHSLCYGWRVKFISLIGLVCFSLLAPHLVCGALQASNLTL